ncbi:MAG: hypothetical protein ABI488_23610 [Polyangiaceae bacterium]
MKPAERESVRAVLDQTRTPDNALARRLLARPVFEFDLDNPLRVDDCERCGSVHWRDCICDPSLQRGTPTDAEIEKGRAERLTRAERGVAQHRDNPAELET